TTDDVTWTLGNLSSLTETPGTYTLALIAAGSGITDTDGNPLTENVTDTWRMTAPSQPAITDDVDSRTNEGNENRRGGTATHRHAGGDPLHAEHWVHTMGPGRRWAHR